MLPQTRNRGSAFDTLVDVSRQMDRLMNSVRVAAPQNNGAIWSLPTEVIESTDELRFDMEIPGVRLEDIDVTLEHNTLTITVDKKLERDETRSDSDYLLFERRYGRFQRSFTVPPTVRVDACDARYENGVLTLRLPKAEEARPRRIRVEAGTAPRQPDDVVRQEN
jgi:HSP20 family protein